MIPFIAAGVQIAITPNDLEKNTEKVCAWLKKAKKEHKADLAVFPESVLSGFTPALPLLEIYQKIAQPLDNPYIEKIATQCRKSRVHAVISFYERGSEFPLIYNSAVLIDDEGQTLGVYRKTHPFPTERIGGGGWTTPGEEPVVVKTKLGDIGMIICYDGDFPELSRVLALKGAEIIVRPSALLRSYEIWELTNMARAYDNHIYLIAVNAVGPDAGNNYYFGHSMIISPIAQKLALARGGEEIISAKLNPEPLKYVSYGTKAPMIFDHLEDRNLKAYKDILTKGKSRFEPAKRIPYWKGEEQ
ncbi:nitrilase [Carboxydothermus islandicus]|uniref:Nitrilase n=1 Tax=Carboxydothermus islandicus TaxID=661089 RepID=A0A1L8D3P2_9THEO|nr:carbon-nitrogen hydrolase family protein [Carboxydothermus islandicus]GAV25691.1 nitrilase [Carboxydothermus islandicus]